MCEVPREKSVFFFLKSGIKVFGFGAEFLTHLLAVIQRNCIFDGFAVPEAERYKKIPGGNTDAAVFQKPMKCGGVFGKRRGKFLPREEIFHFSTQIIGGDPAFGDTGVLVNLIKVIFI